MNYFDIFGLDTDYNIETSIIEERYLNLQKKFHPDNFDSVELQIQAADKIIVINEAYDVLKDENSILEHYLEVQGYALNQDEIKEILPKSDLSFLLDIQEGKYNIKQILKEKLLSIRLTLIQAIKDQNEDKIRLNLAKLSFFNKSLKNT